MTNDINRLSKNTTEYQIWVKEAMLSIIGDD